MSFKRQDMADVLRHLNSNAHWGHYVRMLEQRYNDAVAQLLRSDHPDEAKRGECRSLLDLLTAIHTNSGPTP